MNIVNDKLKKQFHFQPIRISPKRQKSSPADIARSIDAEGLFDFEGIDDPLSNVDVDDESDKDDDEMSSATSRPRGIPARNSLAKSLPINIPAFLSEVRNSSTEDLDDCVSKINDYFLSLLFKIL